MEPSIWRIGPELGSSSDYIATCADAAYADSPEECRHWTFVDGEDSDLEVTLDSCPDITDTCSELFVTYWSVQDSDSCDGTYEAHSQHENVYTRSTTSGSMFLY